MDQTQLAHQLHLEHDHRCVLRDVYVCGANTAMSYSQQKVEEIRTVLRELELNDKLEQRIQKELE